MSTSNTSNFVTLLKGAIITVTFLMIIAALPKPDKGNTDTKTATSGNDSIAFIAAMKEQGARYARNQGINSVKVTASWKIGGTVASIDHALNKADIRAINNTGMPINHALAQVACIDFANNTPKEGRTHSLHVTASSNGGNTATVKCW